MKDTETINSKLVDNQELAFISSIDEGEFPNRITNKII